MPANIINWLFTNVQRKLNGKIAFIWKNMKFVTYLTPDTESNSKCIVDPNIKHRTVKFLSEDIRESAWPGVYQWAIPKAQSIIGKIDKLDLMKMKNLLWETVKRTKRQPTDPKMCKSCLHLRTCVQCLKNFKIQTQEDNLVFKKGTKDLSLCFTKEIWQINIWKNVQYHQSFKNGSPNHNEM